MKECGTECSTCLFSLRNVKSTFLNFCSMNQNDSSRVIYVVSEYSNLCDSSNMCMDDWTRIAMDIKVCYTNDVNGGETTNYKRNCIAFVSHV